MTFVATLTSSLQAGVTALDFTSLPSAQGWNYFQNLGLAETSAFSVSGGVLTLDTMGVAHSHQAQYILPDIVDPLLPYTFELTARVLEHSENNPSVWPHGFGFIIGTDSSYMSMSINPTQIAYGNPVTFVSTSIDNTQFHDYRVEGTPGIGWEFFVDDVSIGSGSFLSSGVLDLVAFGDNTGNGRARAEITSFSFSQAEAVPEPSTYALILTGLLGLGVVRRKRMIQ